MCFEVADERGANKDATEKYHSCRVALLPLHRVKIKMLIHTHNLPVSGLKPVLVKRILEHKTDCNHGDNDVE